MFPFYFFIFSFAIGADWDCNNTEAEYPSLGNSIWLSLFFHENLLTLSTFSCVALLLCKRLNFTQFMQKENYPVLKCISCLTHPYRLMILSSGQSSFFQWVHFHYSQSYGKYFLIDMQKHLTTTASFVQSQDFNFLLVVFGVHLWAPLPAVAAGNRVRHKNASAPRHLLCHRESQRSGKIQKARPGECMVANIAVFQYTTQKRGVFFFLIQLLDGTLNFCKKLSQRQLLHWCHSSYHHLSVFFNLRIHSSTTAWLYDFFLNRLSINHSNPLSETLGERGIDLLFDLLQALFKTLGTLFNQMFLLTKSVVQIAFILVIWHSG